MLIEAPCERGKQLVGTLFRLANMFVSPAAFTQPLRYRDQSAVASPKEVSACYAIVLARKSAGRLASEQAGTKLERQFD